MIMMMKMLDLRLTFTRVDRDDAQHLDADADVEYGRNLNPSVEDLLHHLHPSIFPAEAGGKRGWRRGVMDQGVGQANAPVIMDQQNKCQSQQIVIRI